MTDLHTDQVRIAATGSDGAIRREQQCVIWSAADMRLLIRVLLVTVLLPFVRSIGPLAPIVAIGAVAAAGYKYLQCNYRECCQEPWIRTSPAVMEQLQKNISDQLYGQPFAKKVVFKAVQSQILEEEPVKPLVMSLHGGPGTGKNHICEIIARGLFRLGAESSFYTRISGSAIFPYHDSRSIRKYREVLKNIVEDKLSSCKVQLFVIDEVDKIAPGILDVLTPFFDYSTGSLTVDARSSIFVFLR